MILTGGIYENKIIFVAFLDHQGCDTGLKINEFFVEYVYLKILEKQ